jgi:hypothetical protein
MNGPARGSLLALACACGLLALGMASAPRGLHTPWTPDDVVLPSAHSPAPRLWLCLGGTPDMLRDRLDVPGATLYTCDAGEIRPIEDRRDVVRWVTPVPPRGSGPDACPPEPCPPVAAAGRARAKR